MWSVRVNRNLQDWEVDDYNNLLLCFTNIKLAEYKVKRVWKLDEKRGFLVKSFYNYLSERDGRDGMTTPFKQI